VISVGDRQNRKSEDPAPQRHRPRSAERTCDLAVISGSARTRFGSARSRADSPIIRWRSRHQPPPAARPRPAPRRRSAVQAGVDDHQAVPECAPRRPGDAVPQCAGPDAPHRQAADRRSRRTDFVVVVALDRLGTPSRASGGVCAGRGFVRSARHHRRATSRRANCESELFHRAASAGLTM
jgi:hypothetical protein